MNKVIEKLKDLFYDNTDYVIILVIIISVSGVIAWRLNSLFNENNKISTNEIESTIEKENTEGSKESKPKSNVSDDLIEKEKRKQKGTVVVTIPEGSLPDVIANILLDKSVITDKFEFLKKSQEMGLDTQLRSGEYEFEKDESVEDVIRKVAKQ